MIDGKTFELLVKLYFSFLVREFDFILWLKKIQGNSFYDIQYKDKSRIISISYENIENYLQVIIFQLDTNGKLPDYDDKSKTIHLGELTKAMFLKVDEEEISQNNEYFKNFRTQSEFERNLLKLAKS